MKKLTRSIFAFALLLVLIMLTLHTSVGQVIDEDVRELRPLYAFPDEDRDDIFLAQPERLAVVDSVIYISDFQLNAILQFRTNGQFIKQVGRPGQGPDEFLYPSEFAYADGKIYLRDSNNGRIQIFDREVRHVDGFKIFNIQISDLAGHDGLIYTVDLSALSEDFVKGEGLITVYDENGRITSRFGDYMNPSPRHNLSRGLSKSWLSVYDDHLYVLSAFYPVLHVYTFDGDLVQVVPFEEKQREYERMVPGNYKWDDLTENQAVISTRFLFRAVDVNEHGIFVGLYSEHLVIDHYDHSGRFVQRYVKRREASEDRHYLADFEVVENEAGTLTFFILDRQGIPCVCVFEADGSF